MSNLALDLRHAHAMDMHGKRVFSTDPAPQVRRSHGATSSTFRGQQLLSTVQGRRLEVASLCAIHDRERGTTPDGSVRGCVVAVKAAGAPGADNGMLQVIFSG